MALIVLLPFVAASSSVLASESRGRTTVSCRGRSLSALTLLVLGVGCSLCVVHAHS